MSEQLVPVSIHAGEERSLARLRSVIAAYLDLAKARLSSLVVVTTLVGFVLASEAIDWPLLIATLVGVALAAFGANALNQWLEADRDRRMRRTRERPLPSGRLTSGQALAFAASAAVAGPLILAWHVNLLTGLLGLLTLAAYVLVYTPLKVRTPLNTLVGALVGAVPPMMGWTAVTGEIGVVAWILGGILFVWQIPHFLALAWMHRADYEQGGFRMLPCVDPRGTLTFPAILAYAALLTPLCLSLVVAGIAGWIFGVGSVALCAGFVWLSWRLFRERTDVAARRVFLASVLYLPLLLGLLICDRVPPENASARAQAAQIDAGGRRT